MMDIIHAPFTPEQVKRLNIFQQSGAFHPFTCQHRDTHPADAVLIAATHGWYCLHCDYAQTWAHAFMLNEELPHAL